VRWDGSGFVLSVYLTPLFRNFSVKFKLEKPKTSAKVKKEDRTPKKEKLPLDTFLEKRPRGRPVKIKASWVRGRADNYRLILDQIWNRISPRLLKAQTREDVIRSYEGADIGAYALEFVQLADLILHVLNERKFPKQSRKAQINFLADSIGGHGVIAPRSSRDVCEKERARIKRIHHILRYEFWVHCSCGYKGRSLNHACPKCEAEIPLAIDLGGGGVSS